MIIITRDVFPQLIDMCLDVLSRHVITCPASIQHDEDEKPLWKAKKWALRILLRIHSVHIRPGFKRNEYVEYSKLVMTQECSFRILEVLMQFVYDYGCDQSYVSPRVLADVMNYFQVALLDKSLSQDIISVMLRLKIIEVIHTAMCHDSYDERLWKSQPDDYSAFRFDTYSLYPTDQSRAAQRLLHVGVATSKDLFRAALTFILQRIDKDGPSAQENANILYMLATMARVLQKNDPDEFERILVKYVFKQCRNEQGYVRATAFWLMGSVPGMMFRVQSNERKAIDLLMKAMMDEHQVIRKLATYAFLNTLIVQGPIRYIMRNICNIIENLFKTMQETDQFDCISLVKKVVVKYGKENCGVAVELCEHLAQLFGKMIGCGNSNATKSILTTLETIVGVIAENEAAVVYIQKSLKSIVSFICENNVSDLSTNMISLIRVATAHHVSPKMWELLKQLREYLTKNVHIFQDMLHVVYNWVTVDARGFSSNTNHFSTVADLSVVMSLRGTVQLEEVLDGCDLFEVVLQTYQGDIDSDLYRCLVHDLMAALTEEKLLELRKCYLQVLLSTLYHYPALFVESQDNITVINASSETQTLMEYFMQLLLDHVSHFQETHNQKLCVLALCALLDYYSTCPSGASYLSRQSDRIMSTLIYMLLQGLPQCYQLTRGSFLYPESGSDGESQQSDLDTVDTMTTSSFQMEALDGRAVTVYVERVFKIPVDEHYASINEFRVFQILYNRLEQQDSPLIAGHSQTRLGELQRIFVLAELKQSHLQSQCDA